MKEFNLQKAINGERLVTREGLPVKGFHYYPDARGVFKCTALVYRNGGWDMILFNEKGKIYGSIDASSAGDLLMYEKVVKGYFNVNLGYTGLPSLQEAIAMSQKYDTHQLEITFINGEPTEAKFIKIDKK